MLERRSLIAVLVPTMLLTVPLYGTAPAVCPQGAMFLHEIRHIELNYAVLDSDVVACASVLCAAHASLPGREISRQTSQVYATQRSEMPRHEMKDMAGVEGIEPPTLGLEGGIVNYCAGSQPLENARNCLLSICPENGQLCYCRMDFC